MEKTTNYPSCSKKNGGKRCRGKWFEKRKAKEEQLWKEIENLGLKSSVEQIQSLGCFKIKQILKELTLNENDIVKTVASLQFKKLKTDKRKENREKRLEEMINELNLGSLVDEIKSRLPECRERRIVHALKKNNNEIEKTIQFLTDKTWKFEKKEIKYKEAFPNDITFDWKKYREMKISKRTKKLEEKYNKIFPNDNYFDWEKFKKNNADSKIKRLQDHVMREKFLLKEFKKEDFKTLYLDGNNMLFIDKSIRKFCLSKKMDVACEKLAQLSFIYTNGICSIDTILIFDSIKIVYEKESDGVKFKVCSAHPNYKTSDDALVEWGAVLSASELATSLFVTSDKGLSSRLIELGVTNLMKSGTWWKIMKESIGEDIFNDIINKSD